MSNEDNKVNPIVEFVNQSISRYSLNRPLNFITEYNGEQVYSIPYFTSIEQEQGDVYESVTNNVRIDLIANKYYNDPKLWWIIAMVNNISNPLSIEYGTVLRIPSYSSLIKNGVIK